MHRSVYKLKLKYFQFEVYSVTLKRTDLKLVEWTCCSQEFILRLFLLLRKDIRCVRDWVDLTSTNRIYLHPKHSQQQMSLTRSFTHVHKRTAQQQIESNKIPPANKNKNITDQEIQIFLPIWFTYVINTFSRLFTVTSLNIFKRLLTDYSDCDWKCTEVQPANAPSSFGPTAVTCFWPHVFYRIEQASRNKNKHTVVNTQQYTIKFVYFISKT